MSKSLIQANENEGRSDAVSADSCGALSWAEQIEQREGDACRPDSAPSVQEEFQKLMDTQAVIQACQTAMQEIRFPMLNITQ